MGAVFPPTHPFHGGRHEYGSGYESSAELGYAARVKPPSDHPHSPGVTARSAELGPRVCSETRKVTQSTRATALLGAVLG